jgi:hypothetical protein
VIALLVVIAIGAVVGYLLLRHHSGSPSSGSHPPPSTIANTVPLHAITAFDPYGSPPGQEHNADAHYATDGNPTTFWATEHYHDAPSLGKPGVGLILDAGGSMQLRQIGLATATPGFVAEIKASNDPSSFAQVVAPPRTTTGQTYYTLSGGSFRYYLIWITRLGPSDDQAYINEVKAN